MSPLFTYSPYGRTVDTPLHQAVKTVNDFLASKEILLEYAFRCRTTPHDVHSTNEEISSRPPVSQEAQLENEDEISQLKEALTDGVEVDVMTPEAYNAILRVTGVPKESTALFRSNEQSVCGWYPKNSRTYRKTIFINEHVNLLLRLTLFKKLLILTFFCSISLGTIPSNSKTN